MTDAFFDLGKSKAISLGLPGLPIIVVPHPMADRSPEQITEIAGQSFDEALHILTADAASLEKEYKAKYGIEVKEETSPNDIVELPDSLEEINSSFYKQGWTDGFPIIPPTEERLEKMLKGIDEDPRQVIGQIPPESGTATVEKIAVNMIMAGCIPEHFPVVLAATKAMIHEDFRLYSLQTTTHLCTVLVMVNGPVVDRLGINYSYNAMGQGNLHNATIGRAIRLILMNLGGAAPGRIDKATFGTPAKYSFCFAENEKENPWGPLHVERGFDREESVVTVFGSEAPHNVNDHGGSSGEEILITVAGVLATPGANHIYMGGQPLVVLGPEHASIMVRDGFTKEDVKNFLFEKARVPLKMISAGNLKRYQRVMPHRFANLGDATSVPFVDRPEDIIIVVSGGRGRHSVVIPSFGATTAVSVKV